MRQLLSHARQAGGAAQHRGRHVGIAQGVDAGHLQRAEKAADEQCQKNHQVRRIRPEQAIAKQERSADHGIADQHDAETQGPQDAHCRGLHQHRAGRAREGQEARIQCAEAEPDLQHQWQQKRQRAEPHPKQKSADRGRGIGRDAEERQIDDRMRHTAGMAEISHEADHADRQEAEHAKARQSAAADILKTKGEGCEPDTGQYKAAAVQRPAPSLLQIADQEIDEHDAQHPDRDVDEKYPAP